MFTVFTVNSAVLEVVVAYHNLTVPTGHILICLHTQIACMLPTSSTLMMMIVTNGAKIGATYACLYDQGFLTFPQQP
jgi:hypothetical protein